MSTGYEHARCPECGLLFARPIDEQWKTLCLSCFKRTRGRKAGFTAPNPAPVLPAIPEDMLRRLLHLCHPDKHGNSKASTEVTQWLLQQRKQMLGRNLDGTA